MLVPPSKSAIAQAALVVAFALGGLGCGSSRPAGPGGATVREEADGSITIAVDDGASAETLTAALMAAAQMTAWEPPESAPHLRRVERTDMGVSGVAHRYRMDHTDGRFDVYVYRHSSSAEAQVAETQGALAQLVDEGRVESVTVARPLEAQEIVWHGQPTALYRVVFGERVRGAATDSYMYLLRDDIFWIKVRVSVPAGQTTVAGMDALVLGLLGA